MSKPHDSEEAGRLQYETEHTFPQRGHSVMRYLAVLAAAAFLLLLMAFLMQQRANQAALDTLQQTSSSAVESLENLIEDNRSLRDRVAQLEDRLAQQEAQAQADAQAGADELQKARDALEELERRESLLSTYALLETAVRDRDYERAASLLTAIYRDYEERELDLGLVGRNGEGLDLPERLADLDRRLRNAGYLKTDE